MGSSASELLTNASITTLKVSVYLATLGRSLNPENHIVLAVQCSVG